MCTALTLESSCEESIHPAFPQGNCVVYSANCEVFPRRAVVILLDSPAVLNSSFFLYCRYLLFMKLAALQLMQQKANKPESSGALENGASAENGTADSEKSESEDGKIDDNVTGLDQVKELAETIASDDGTGISSSAPGAARASCPAWGAVSLQELCQAGGSGRLFVVKQEKHQLLLSALW